MSDQEEFPLGDEVISVLRPIIESLLLASDEPISTADICATLREFHESDIARTIAQLKLDWTGPATGIHLSEVAGGYQLRTNPDHHAFVLRLFESKPARLSKAALETLAIVAYRQPITRAQIDEVRGVDSGGILKRLTELELAVVIGRMDDIGRPNLYGTTSRFLEFFGLRDLRDLPTLEDLDLESLDLRALTEEE